MQNYLFHGTTADPLDILIHGLEAREDRDGVSVTTKPERAEDWAGLKRGEVYILRIPRSQLTTLIPENAAPADPRYDFTTDRIINPLFIQVRPSGKKWLSMIDAYGELLSEGEMEDWKRKWLYGQPERFKKL